MTDYRVLTPERSAELLALCHASEVYPILTLDRWHDPIAIFEGWDMVKKVFNIAADNMTPEEIDLIPDHAKREEGYYDLDWLVSSMVFADQYSQCDFCGDAVCLDDPNPLHWQDQNSGDITCIDCMQSDEYRREDYLVYCANSLGLTERNEKHREIARPSFANPLDFGFVRLNNWSDASEEDMAKYPEEIDHSDYIGDLLTYGSEALVTLLDKARRLIDPNLQIVAQYTKYGQGYIFYARFDPDHSEEEIAASRLTLDYAMGLVFAKWHKLYNAK